MSKQKLRGSKLLDKLGNDDDGIQSQKKLVDQMERKKRKEEKIKRLGDEREERIKKMTPEQKLKYDKMLKGRQQQKKIQERALEKKKNLKNAKMKLINDSASKVLENESIKKCYKNRIRKTAQVLSISSGATSILFAYLYKYTGDIGKKIKIVQKYSGDKSYSLNHGLFASQYIK